MIKKGESIGRIPFHPSKEVGIEESDDGCQDDKDARLAAQGVTQSLQNLKHDGLFFLICRMVFGFLLKRGNLIEGAKVRKKTEKQHEFLRFLP